MNLQAICDNVRSISAETGEFLLSERARFDRDRAEYKGKNDLVSYVDKQAERMIVEKLSALLPEAGFIAEEGTGEPNQAGLNWIVDPLDGTTNFIHGLPVFSTSIALAQGDDLLVAAICEANRRENFYAWKGGGAFLNGEPIRVSSADTLDESLLATGFPYYDFEQLDRYIKALYELMQSSHGLRRMGSAAVDLAYVACGRFEAFFEYNLNSWDVAAGALLVREAGGKATDFSGGPDCVFGREMLAAGPVHAQALAVIGKHFAKTEQAR